MNPLNSALASPSASSVGLASRLRRSLRRALWMCVVLSLTGVAGLVFWLEHDRREHIEADVLKLGVSTELLAAHVERSLDSIDAILIDVVEKVRHEGLAGLSGQAGHDFLEGQARHLRGLASVFVYDLKGDTLSTSVAVKPPAFNVASRNYFRALLSGAAEPFIDKALVGKTVHKYFFPVARRLVDAQGKVVGVVQVGVPIDFIASLLRLPELHSYQQVAVYRVSDGMPVAVTLSRGDWLDRAVVDAAERTFATSPDAEWAGPTTFEELDATRAIKVLGNYALAVTAVHTHDALLKGFWSGYGSRFILCALLFLSFEVAFILWYRSVKAQIRLVESQHNRLLEENSQANNQIGYFEHIVDSASDAIIAKDLSGRVLSWNRSAETLFGYGAEEMIGQSVLCLFPDDAVAEERRILERVSAGESVAAYDALRRTKSGKLVDVSVMVSPIRDHQGQVIGASTIIHDITERVLAQQRLEVLVAERTESLNEHLAEQQATLSALEIARIGCLWLSGDGRVLKVNQQAARMFGQPENDLLGKAIDSLHPSLAGIPFTTITNSLSQCGYMRLEMTQQRRDGRQVPTEVIFTHRPATASSAAQVVCFEVDISIRKATEAQLHQSLGRLQAAAAAGIVGIWDWDVVNDELYWDSVMYRIYDLPYEDFPGTFGSWMDKLHPEDVGRVRAAVDAALHDQAKTLDLDFRNLRPNGELRHIRLAGQLSFDAEGRALRIVGVNYDETAQKENESRLKAALSTADEAVAAKGRFLANMSHEIRTPIGAVLGIADIGQRDTRDPATRELFQKIQGAGKHLLGIVNDILDLSKIEAGKLAVNLGPMRLAESLSNMTSFAESLLENKKRVNFVTQIEGNLPEWVIGDGLRVQQILTNLISNAVKFTEQGTITLKISRHEDDCKFSVCDTGIGISDDALARLFQPFEQAGADTAAKFGGTGLGLSISRRLADLLGGSIDVTSQPGVGSAFTLAVPLRECPREDIPVGSGHAESEVEPLAGLRVLACDDVELNRFILDDLLSSLGARSTIVDGGQAAIDAALAADAHFDIVLMDLQMPGVDGFEASRQIRAARPDLPIVAVTANVLREQRDACLALGMGHLAKPIDVKALIAVVRQQVGGTPRPASSAVIVPLRMPPPVESVSPPAPTVSDENTATHIVDWVALEARYGRKPERYAALLQNACDTLAGKIETLDRALGGGDFSVLASQAHQVKGFAGGLMAERVHLQALALESAVHANAPEIADEARHFLNLLKAWRAELEAYQLTRRVASA